MSSYPKLKNKIQDLQKSGYDVHGHYMFTPPHISAKRSIDRFVKTGRHVPIKHILDSTENESSFDANNLDFPMGFNPFVGIFKTLPKDKILMTDDFYEKIRNGEFFEN